MQCYSYFLCVFLLSNLLGTQALPVDQDSTLLEDDIRLTPEQLEYLKGNAKARNVKLWSGYYWPQSTLVYSIGQGMTPLDVLLVTQAMSGISDQSCVRFRRTVVSSEPQVVIERTDSGCWSYIGYLGHRQILNLGIGCMNLGTIQHELLHALAFLHMQNDPKRNEFIRIAVENIKSGMEHNFDIYNSKDVGDFGLGYDYNSILHYGAYAFSKNNKATIIPLQNNVKIGQRVGLSPKDVLKLKHIYC